MRTFLDGLQLLFIFIIIPFLASGFIEMIL